MDSKFKFLKGSHPQVTLQRTSHCTSHRGHKSIRRNALIADLLHRIEFIEKAGTGIKRIRDEARAQGCPEPRFEETGFFTAIFFPNPEVRTQAATQKERVAPQVGTKSAPGRHQVTPQVTPQVAAILKAAFEGPRLREELQKAVGLRDREHFRKGYLEPLLTVGWLERTIPDKPRSSRQRYRTTAAGRKVVEKKDLR